MRVINLVLFGLGLYLLGAFIFGDIGWATISSWWVYGAKFVLASLWLKDAEAYLRYR